MQNISMLRLRGVTLLPVLLPSDTSRVAHFGVFDGHGGVSCATHVSQQLHRHVLQAGLLSKVRLLQGLVWATRAKASNAAP